jgi:hypothetical protein
VGGGSGEKSGRDGERWKRDGGGGGENEKVCKTNKNTEGFVPEKSQITGESILFDEAADRLASSLGQ